MNEITLKLSISKIVDIALAEQKAGIKKHLMATVGQPGSDLIDSYVPAESGILQMLLALTD